jgi:hypothetical protein
MWTGSVVIMTAENDIGIILSSNKSLIIVLRNGGSQWMDRAKPPSRFGIQTALTTRHL